MPRPGRRQFAKSSADTRHFRLIARSQHDPEGDNPDSTPLVLEPFVPQRLANKKGVDEAELLAIPESLQHLDADVFGLEPRGVQPKSDDFLEHDGDSEDEDVDEFAALDDDCYFPKDGYNYNQHLKTLSSDKKKGGVGGVIIDAPKAAADDATSTVLRKPGVIERNIDAPLPQNDEELEVMKALDDPEIYEEIDDEFFDDVVPSGIVDAEVVLWGPAALEKDDGLDIEAFKAMHKERLGLLGGDGEEEDDEYETEGAGVQEAGARPNAARFEQLLEDEYGDDEIGAMDDDEIEGPLSMENMEALLDEYLDDRETERQQMESMYEPVKGKYDDIPRVTEETKAIIERHYENQGDEDAETSEGESEEDSSRNWDCETVLSTLSNLSNRPGKIGKIKLVKKPAKELEAIKESGKDAEEEDDDDEDAVELPDVVTERPRGESTEDRKARKAAVKEMRRICRKMKKETKDMYKNEKEKLNNNTKGTGDLREKLRCVKL